MNEQNNNKRVVGNSYAQKQPRLFPLSMLLVPALVLGLRIASGPTANLSYLVLAAWAMTGRAQAIQALFLSFVMTMLNPGLAPAVSLGAIGRYAVILGAMASVLLRVNFSGRKMIVGHQVSATLGLGLFLIIHALFVSAIPDVSILKSVSFVIVFATLLSAWHSLTPLERVRTEIFVFGGMIAVVLVSLPFIVTGVGYLRNGTGFQGIFNQPQAFGPFVAVLGAWFGGRFISESKLPLWQSAFLFLCLVMIMASKARTAGGAFSLGMALPLIFALLLSSKRNVKVLSGLFTKRFMVVIWGATLGILAFGVVMLAQLDQYLLKSGGAETSFSESIDASRGSLLREMLGNIEENPVSGIGFGIASFLDEMVVERDPFFGLPLSASIEKGVMPVAIVEEVGILGAIFVFSWLWMLIISAGRSSFVSLVVIVTVISTNLGEYMFFSVGGLGMIMMIVTTWAVTPRLYDPLIKVPLWIK